MVMLNADVYRPKTPTPAPTKSLEASKRVAYLSGKTSVRGSGGFETTIPSAALSLDLFGRIAVFWPHIGKDPLKAAGQGRLFPHSSLKASDVHFAYLLIFRIAREQAPHNNRRFFFDAGEDIRDKFVIENEPNYLFLPGDLKLCSRFSFPIGIGINTPFHCPKRKPIRRHRVLRVVQQFFLKRCESLIRPQADTFDPWATVAILHTVQGFQGLPCPPRWNLIMGFQKIQSV